MQVTGSDILGYKGDVGLGLNADGIGQYGDTDTRELNNAVFNLAYLNQQKNKAVWEQKIKDRDSAMEKIAAGQLEVNQALPQDREVLRGMIEDVKNMWLEKGGDVKSDPNTWIEFNDKLAVIQGKKKTATSRFLDYYGGQAEAAKEKNPLRKAKMQEHWAAQLSKPVDEEFMPYQQTMDWDFGVVMPDLPALTTTKREGYDDVITKTTDVAKAYNDYLIKYEYDDKQETAPNIDAFYDNFFGIDGAKDLASVGQSVNTVNNRLKKIATDMGLDPTKPETLPNYLRPIQMLANDPTTGKPGTSDTKQVAAFKVALALKHENTTTRKYNEDYAKQDKTKAEIEKIGAEIGKIGAERDAQRALAKQRLSVIPVNQAKTKYWNSKATVQDNESKVYNIFDDVTARAKTYKFTEGTKKIVWVGDLPKGFHQVLAGVDKDGKPIRLEPKKRSNGALYFEVAKSPFYISGAGKRYSEAEIRSAYENQSTHSTYEAFIKSMEESGFRQDTELVGANGRGTSQATIQALRSLSNKSKTQKSDDELFDEGDNDTGEQ